MADDPITQAQKDNYAYTGESGARDTKKSLLWNKTPEDAARLNRDDDRGIAERAAYIATKGYSRRTKRSGRK